MGCDRDFFVTGVTFVSRTRDRADADIHVLVTSRETGSGGTQYTVRFIGQRRFASHADTFVAHSNADATPEGRHVPRVGVFPTGPLSTADGLQPIHPRGARTVGPVAWRPLVGAEPSLMGWRAKNSATPRATGSGHCMCSR